MKIKFLLIFAILSHGLLSFASAAEPQGRYYLEGDGTVRLQNAKTGLGGTVRYRDAQGTYPQEATQKINRIFGITTNSSENISLRLIALLDYLQDHFKGGPISIVSGYRSPQYNEGLRKKGKLAARTSLHIEGMAADIDMKGVDGKTLWDHIRTLHCCGVGYYHSTGIHVDTGPDRFWDETSTKVDKDLGGHNKLILLRTDRDIYRPGETIHLTLNRITDYPVALGGASLVQEEKEIETIALTQKKEVCLSLTDRSQAKSISWEIPEKISPKEKLKIRIRLCEKPFPEMPDQIESNPFSVR